ncbi:DUF6279 family lipoprotein [Vibrio gallaecicus]|uniref:DUF6279 family lipoprotein n=1 Tax=Vibrio gallaecicus TaxID=552386 RepID=A0ABV4N998_9VIBR
MKLLKWWQFVIVCLLMTGCGTKFVYNNVDWLILDYLEDFVTLTDSQEDELESRINLLQEWHKHSELPLYIEQISEIQAQKQSQIDAAFILKQRKQLSLHFKTIVSKFAPDIYALSMQMTDLQDKEFLVGLQEKQKESAEEFLLLSENETRERYEERISKSVKRWLGTISESQEEVIVRWVGDLKNTNAGWLDYQSTIYAEVSKLMNNKSDRHTFQPTLMSLLLSHESYYSAELKVDIDYNAQISANYLSTIVSLASDKQWTHFQSELRDLKEVVAELN